MSIASTSCLSKVRVHSSLCDWELMWLRGFSMLAIKKGLESMSLASNQQICELTRLPTMLTCSLASSAYVLHKPNCIELHWENDASLIEVEFFYVAPNLNTSMKQIVDHQEGSLSTFFEMGCAKLMFLLSCEEKMTHHDLRWVLLTTWTKYVYPPLHGNCHWC